MTDSRIEAALNAAWSHTIQHQGGMSFAQYQDKSPNAAGEFRKAIVAAIEAADTASWSPIEIAPRDGTRIMIRKTTGHICVALFDDGEWYADDWYYVHHDEYITHWQPVPKGPEQ